MFRVVLFASIALSAAAIVDTEAPVIELKTSSVTFDSTHECDIGTSTSDTEGVWDSTSAAIPRMTTCFDGLPECQAWDKHDTGLGCSVEVEQTLKQAVSPSGMAQSHHSYGSGDTGVTAANHHLGCTESVGPNGNTLTSCKDIFDDYEEIWNVAETDQYADFYARKSSYSLKYSAQDRSGNDAESVIFNVEFVDNTPCEVRSYGNDISIPSGAFPYTITDAAGNSHQSSSYEVLALWSTTAIDRGYNYCKNTGDTANNCLTGTDDITDRLVYSLDGGSAESNVNTLGDLDVVNQNGVTYTFKAEANDGSGNTCEDTITITVEDHQFPQHVLYPVKQDATISNVNLKKIVGADAITTHDAAFAYNLYRTAGGFHTAASATYNNAKFMPPVVGFTNDGAYTATDYCVTDAVCEGSVVTSGVTAHSYFAQVIAKQTKDQYPADAADYEGQLHYIGDGSSNTVEHDVECNLNYLAKIGHPAHGTTITPDNLMATSHANEFDAAQHADYTVPKLGCKDETFTPVTTHATSVATAKTAAWDPIVFDVQHASENAGTGDNVFEAYACGLGDTPTEGTVGSIRRTIGVVDTIAPTLNIFSEFRMCVQTSVEAQDEGENGIEEAAWDSVPEKMVGDEYLGGGGPCVHGKDEAGNRQFGPDDGDANDGYDPSHTFTGGIDDYTIQHSAGYQKDMYFIESLTVKYTGYWCTDLCEGDLSDSVTTDWFSGEQACGESMSDPVDGNAFNSYEVGTYVLRYTCQDSATPPNVATKCRTVENEDRSKPILAVLGFDSMTLEATTNGNYVDDGATCSDRIDGMISQNVEVSGDVVNLSNTDTYEITYRCTDSTGHTAWPLTRTVYVRDSGCPTCTISQDSEITREVSFPYTNILAHVTCSDFLDGSSDEMEDGVPKIAIVPEMDTTVQEGTGPHTYNDLINGVNGITTPFAPANDQVTGVYYITYLAMDANDNWNYQPAGPCPSNNGEYCGAPCVNSAEVDSQQHIRTVHIKDTLRPVITLKAASGTTHGTSTDGEDTGLNHIEDDSHEDFQPNSAYHDSNWEHEPLHGSNPNMDRRLMAENATTSTSLNGWVIGAIASAVTGLSLLAYSMQKKVSNVATSVPV